MNVERIESMDEDEIRGILESQPSLTHLHFGPDDQTVDGLRLALDYLRQLPAKPPAWKWVVIGIHTALQGALVLALSGTDGAGALIQEQREQYYRHIKEERSNGDPLPFQFTRGKQQKPVSEKVDYFKELYARAQNPEHMEYRGFHVLIPPTIDNNAKEPISTLNDLRNRLMHFGSTSLVADALPLLALVENGLGVSEQLLFHTAPWGSLLTFPEDEAHGRGKISEVRIEFQRLRTAYHELEQRGPTLG